MACKISEPSRMMLIYKQIDVQIATILVSVMVPVVKQNTRIRYIPAESRWAGYDGRHKRCQHAQGGDGGADGHRGTHTARHQYGTPSAMTTLTADSSRAIVRSLAAL